MSRVSGGGAGGGAAGTKSTTWRNQLDVNETGYVPFSAADLQGEDQIGVTYDTDSDLIVVPTGVYLIGFSVITGIADATPSPADADTDTFTYTIPVVGLLRLNGTYVETVQVAEVFGFVQAGLSTQNISGLVSGSTYIGPNLDYLDPGNAIDAGVSIGTPVIIDLTDANTEIVCSPSISQTTLTLIKMA